MSNIKIGFIGCGKQASKHISSLKSLPGVELVLGDIQKEFAKGLAHKNDTQWAEHPDDILMDKSVKAVVVCTPTQTHASLIKRAIEEGKDVFCEKPLCETVEEATELHRVVTGSNCIFTVGYIYRYVPIFEEGFKLFRERQINGQSLVMGKPLTAFFRLGGRGDHQVWKHQKATGGGAINEMLVHMFDLANWYFGPIQDIDVISNRLRCPERTINGQKVKADAEDFILVRSIGGNGVEIFCQADLITPAFCQYVEIQSENGTFLGSIQEDMPSYIFLKEGRWGYDAGKTELRFGQRNLFDIQMMAFVQSVLAKKTPDRNTIDESLQLMRILEEVSRQTEKR
ncbi:MAG: Gfo/Idh/MocA family protein [Thermodesulfobacteriota bacterium]